MRTNIDDKRMQSEDNDEAEKLLYAELPVIKKSSLVDEVCQYLRTGIYGFVLKPGQPINESKLMKYTGVSRSPIREAFRILEGEGLIERISQRGVFVKEISLREIRETYAVLAVLEALAAEEATPRLTESQLNQLADMCTKMQGSAQNKDIKLWSELNYRFHKLFIKAANNNLLEKSLKNYQSKTTWFMSAGLHVHEAFQNSLKEHREILEAFSERDAALAAERVRKHIKEAGIKVEQAFMSEKADRE